MTPERWQHIDRLLEQALEVSPERRSEFLDAACRGNPDLRRVVEKLLCAHERAGAFLGSSALEVAARQAVADSTGTLAGRTIAHYDVISRLGAGGMGVVYSLATSSSTVWWPSSSFRTTSRQTRHRRPVSFAKPEPLPRWTIQT